MGNVVFWGMIVYVLLFSMESVVRFLLNKVSLEWTIYFRDLFLLAIVGLGLLVRSPGTRIRSLVLISLFVLIWGTVWGLLTLGNVTQVAFGLKVYLPYLAGIVIAPVFFRQRAKTLRAFVAIFLITAFGVLLTAVVDVPWTGLEYNLGSYTIEGQRDWTIEGIQRLSGFSRASYDASIQLVTCAIVVGTFSRSAWLAWGSWLLCAPCLYLTTSRSPMIAYLCITVFRLWMLMPAKANWFVKRLALILPLLVIILPLLKEIPGLADSAFLESGGVARLDSLATRVDQMWPDAFKMLRTGTANWFGLGIGGIGAGQALVNPDDYNTADNLFVYLWVSFGALSVFIIGALAIGMQRLKLNEASDLCAFEMAIAYFAIGTLSNGMENISSALFLGIFVHQMAMRNRPLEPRPAMSPIHTIEHGVPS